LVRPPLRSGKKTGSRTVNNLTLLEFVLSYKYMFEIILNFLPFGGQLKLIKRNKK